MHQSQQIKIVTIPKKLKSVKGLILLGSKPEIFQQLITDFVDLFSVAADYGAWAVLRSAEQKNSAELLGACAPWSVAIIFLRTLSVGGTPLHKLCTWLLLKKKNFGGNFWRPVPLDRLQFFFYGLCFFWFFGGTPLHKLCTWHLLKKISGT